MNKPTRVTLALLCSAACAAEESSPVESSPKTSTERTPPKPLQLKLSGRELNDIIARHRPRLTSDASQLEEVVVTAPVELLPMKSETQDVWPGLAAPFWALAHPTQAWRIFLPIPPK